jgi:hypothetical protein
MTKLITAIAVLAAVSVGYSQGTVDFQNRNTAFGVDAKVVDLNGAGLEGTAWAAQLYFAPGVVANDSSLQAVGPIVNFRTGPAAGYIQIASDQRAVALPGVAPGAQATLQMRAWNTAAGATYEAAQGNLSAGITGKSNLITVSTGGAGEPPGPPAALVGLLGFQVVPVPEPATIALGLLGAGVLFLRRRK